MFFIQHSSAERKITPDSHIFTYFWTSLVQLFELLLLTLELTQYKTL